MHAGRMEHVIGSLEPGTLADFAVLSGDPEEEDDVAVEEVYLGGKLKYSIHNGTERRA